MHNAWTIAFRNLGRNKRRSTTTGIAMSLGFAGVMLLGGYFLFVENFLRTNAVYLQHLGHVSLYKDGGLDRVDARPLEYSFTRDEQTKIARVLSQVPSIEFKARYVTGVGLAGNGCKTVPFVALGVEPEMEAKILRHPEVLRAVPELAIPVKGRTYPEYADIPGAVGLSGGLARLLGKQRIHEEVGVVPAAAFTVPRCDAPDISEQLAADSNIQLASLTYKGNMSAIDGEVVNVFHTPLAATEDSTLLMGIDKVQQLFDTDLVTYMSVFLKGHQRAREVAAEIERGMRAAGVQATAYAFDDERTSPYYAGSMALLKTIVRFMSILVASVVSLSVVNAMTLTVMERTREIGTLRSIGYRGQQIVGLFVRETVLLTAIAVAIGTSIAFSVAFSVNAANIRFHPPGTSGPIQLLISPTLWLWSIVAAATVSLAALATVVAVRSRSRRNIVHLLTDTTG